MMDGGIDKREEYLMKKILIIALIAISSIAKADDQELTPFPGLKLKDGINMVKNADIMIPGDTRNEDDESIKLKGYAETNDADDHLNFLFHIKKEAPSEIKSYDNSTNPVDSHLRSSYKKIPLAFKFSGIPKVDGRVIGYAAAGGYSQQGGWDGVVTFFEEKDLGICSYTTFAIQKVLLAEEKTDYSVNKKPTVNSIRGNKKSGFLYSLNWYTNNRLHSIECANRSFEPSLMGKIKNLANRVDKKN